MGTDIHFYAEKLVGKKWQELENSNGLYVDRNYNLFAILADVRNGYGFAGVSTGSGFKPIAELRGLPRGTSKSIRKKYKDWEEDAHSASHFTLQELLNYDWEGQVTTHYGIVSPIHYYQWKQAEKIGQNIVGEV